MEAGVLLKRLIESENKDSVLYQCYIESLNSGYTTAEESFNKCIDDLKLLIDKQYDFAWVTKEAPSLGLKRNEYTRLCDEICAMLGDKIKDLCYRPIFTKSSNFEDCPIRADLVMYSQRPFATGTCVTSPDKDTYMIQNCKLETNGYYSIYIHEIEKI